VCLASLLVFAAIFSAAPADAKDVFVSPVFGIDGPPNTGLSASDPFASITFATSPNVGTSLLAGDRIVCLTGVYAPPLEVFPIILPTNVSLVAPSGPGLTFIDPGPGYFGSAVILKGTNTPSDVVSGFSIGGPPAGGPLTGFNGFWVTGGPAVFWPTFPPPALGPGPGVAAPTIADNVIGGFGNAGVSSSGYYGPVVTRMDDNISYYNTYGLFYDCGILNFAGPYPAYSVITGNLLGYNMTGMINVAPGGGAPAYPLTRSNFSVFNASAGHYQDLYAFSVNVNNTMLANS
jgi:hypothetical protein